MRARLMLVVASAALSAISFGCGDSTKVKECNALVAAVNASVTRVETLGKDRTNESNLAVDELRKVADELDAAASDVAKVELTIPQLQKIAASYQKLTGEVAIKSREMATAVDDVDGEKMADTQTEIDKVLTTEDDLVNSLNRFCREL